jgi:hypothetical protein
VAAPLAPASCDDLRDAPRRTDGTTGVLEVFGSFLHILAVSDHEDERD